MAGAGGFREGAGRKSNASKLTEALTTTSATPERDPMRLYQNERGELEVSKAGSVRITQTFLGSSTPADADNTALDNARFAQVASALHRLAMAAEKDL